MTNQTAQTTKKSIWQDSENKVLTAIVISSASQGKTYKEAYVEAAEVLNRSARACETQWQKHLKSKNRPKINLETVGKEITATPELGFDEPKKWVQRALQNLTKPTGPIDFQALAENLQKQIENAPDVQVELSVNEFTKNLLQSIKTPLDSVASNIYEAPVADVSSTSKATKPAKPVQSKLKMLIKSVSTLESENLKVLNSGKGGTDYMVINNEEDFGYLVTTDGEKVTGCNCPHHVHRGAICKHMLKVAMEKNLEVF
jgi:hypothetical protein